mmetsp:Transcript_109490/g.316519  ORF Transcript_109490/g.316519 Transcript_109490/m.316519 type:complete len:478 (+) Transcript_109490:75-1508(+)
MRGVQNSGRCPQQRGDYGVEITTTGSVMAADVDVVMFLTSRTQDGDAGKIAEGDSRLFCSPRSDTSSQSQRAVAKSKSGTSSDMGPSALCRSPLSSRNSSGVSPQSYKPKLKSLGTGLSSTSGASSSSVIRARDQPKLRRSITALSVASMRSGMTGKSSILETIEFDMDETNGISSVPVTSHWPIQDIYEFHHELGRGSYGTVWMGVNRQSGDQYAIKCIATSRLPDVERLEAEMKILARLRNPYIVSLHEVYRDKEHLHLVMDLCHGGDLMDYLMNYWAKFSADVKLMHLCGGLPWREVPPLLWQMLAAAAYLHHNRFIHRDIKLENFMLESSCQRRPRLLLADFGLAIRIDRGQTVTGAVGSLMYVAPEVILSSYTTKCDIWSIGVTGYCLCTRRNPWGDDSSHPAMMQAITNNAREDWPASDKPPELKALIDRLCTFEPEQRPSAKSLLREHHSFLRKHGRPQGDYSQRCCSIA